MLLIEVDDSLGRGGDWVGRGFLERNIELCIVISSLYCYIF